MTQIKFDLIELVNTNKHTLPCAPPHCCMHCHTDCCPAALPHTTARTACHTLPHCRTVPHRMLHTTAHTATHCRIVIAYCHTLPRTLLFNTTTRLHTASLSHTTAPCRTLSHCRTAAHRHANCHTL